MGVVMLKDIQKRVGNDDILYVADLQTLLSETVSQ